MGHEVSATSLQLAVAGAVIANGGLAGEAPPGDGAPEARRSQCSAFGRRTPERGSAPETAITMRQMMEGVVLHGTGSGLANLKATRPAAKPDRRRFTILKAHIYTHNYNASFLGFAPVANPQIVIAVTLNHTSGGSAGYGGPVAAPGFPRGRDGRAADAGCA